MVKIRHLGRALLGLAALFVLGMGTTATAQTISAVSDKLSANPTASESQYYVLQNSNHSWYVQEGESNLVPYTSSDLTQAGTEGVKCLVKLLDAGSGNFYIQTISGEYWCKLTKSDQLITTVESTDDAGQYTIALNGASTNGFTLKETVGKYCLDATSSSVIGWGTSTSTAASGNGVYYIIPVTVEGTVEYATVTYNYKVDGTLIGSTTSKQLVGTTIAAPTDYPFLSISSYNATTTVSSGGTSVDVTCTENLPFKVSDDENTYYYALDIHSDDTWGITRYSNSFFVKGEESSVVANTSDIINYSSNAVPAEAYQWVIKGSLIKGFTFYNRSAAKYLTVATGNTENQATLSESASTFKIAKSSVTDTSIPNISDAFCLYIEGNTSDGSIIYLNHRDGDSGGVIMGWTVNNGGSTIIARPIGFFAQKYYENKYAAYQNAPDGAIGALKGADYTDAKAAVATLSSNACDETAAAALVKANTVLDACEKVEVPSSFDGKYYRLVNRYYGTYATYNSSNSKMSSTSATKGVGSVVKFTAIDGTSNYTLSVEGLVYPQVHCYNTGEIVLGSTDDSDFTSGQFSISTSDQITFKITDVSTCTQNDYCTWWERYVKMNASGNSASFSYWSDIDGEQYWYFVPADDAEIALTDIDGTTYGTAFLPFDINGVSGATAYVGVSTTTTDDGTTLTMTPATDVQASNGFVLIGENGVTTAKVTIASATTTSAVLTGTLTGTSTSDSYLVLGKGSTSQKVGFYKYSGEQTTIPANKAFIDNSSTSVIRLDFGDGTTSIDATTLINGEQNNAPVYDLSGRRVTKATRGLYIQGGKKYIAR